MTAPNFIKADILKSVIKNLATSPDHQTTALGLVGGALLAANIDYGKLFAKDPGEIGKAVAVVLIAVFGYLTNKGAAPSA